MNTAILLAAGSGRRMQGTVADKLLAPLNGIPLIAHSLQTFVRSKVIDRYTLAYRDEAQRAALMAALEAVDLNGAPLDWVIGGDERQDSVLNALDAQPEDCAYVFIHDCARPLVSVEALQDLHLTVIRDKAAVLAHPVTDTIKRIPDAGQLSKTELEDLDRSRLWAMETPQAFALPVIRKAYAYVRDDALRITDDTAALAAIGSPVTLVPNSSPNPKITTPADLDYAEWLLSRKQ